MFKKIIITASLLYIAYRAAWYYATKMDNSKPLPDDFDERYADLMNLEKQQ